MGPDHDGRQGGKDSHYPVPYTGANMHNQRAILRYDGRYTFMPGENRQWTILNHFVDADGADRFRGSFGMQGLKELGIVGPDIMDVSIMDRKYEYGG